MDRRITRTGIIKRIEETKPTQDDTDQHLLLAPKILSFLKELEFRVFFIFIKEFLCVSDQESIQLNEDIYDLRSICIRL